MFLNQKSRWNKHYFLSFTSSHLIDYPTPINIHYAWGFGSMAGFCLLVQILTGIFLAMYYCPDVDKAFACISHIMHDVNYGWLIRYLHANGASMFFIVTYLHIFRGLYYGSYFYPTSGLWVSGIVIFGLMMATAFLGYVLPWGQMSFWGATVITNLFSAIPIVGTSIVQWLWGGFSVDNATLNRFYSFHFLLPFLITGMVLVHLGILHHHGSNNPTGITAKEQETIDFYPYFVSKDLIMLFLVNIFLLTLIYYYPNALGHTDNSIPANSLVTPQHIVPEWYFLPFYAILRSIPDKLGGVVAMVGALILLALLPFLNKSPIRNNSWSFVIFFWVFIFDFFVLGWIGQQPAESPYIEIGMIATSIYFLIFLFLIPLIGFLESKINSPKY